MMKPVPADVFYEIRDYLMVLINERRQANQYQMPSENQLADFFGVSRSTIRSVYQQLVDLGYLESVQGKGYYIKQFLPTVNLILRGDQSFSQKMQNQGYDYTSEQLPIEEDVEHFYFSRLRFINGIPMAVHQSCLEKNLFPNFIKEIGEETSLFSYLNKKGYHDFASNQTMMSIQIPDQKLSQLLQCTTLTSLVVLQANCINVPDHQELETSTIFYRSDIVKFQL